MNKVAAYSYRILEGCWLAALVVAPLLINVHGARVFEPARGIVLQALALVALGAGVVWVYAKGRAGLNGAWRTRLKAPVVGGVLLLLLTYVIGSLLSVLPQKSLWGAYHWGFGLFTQGACVVLFLAMTLGVRTRVQIRRIVSTMILSGFVVALYGMVQFYEADPMPWNITWNNEDFMRVASTLGNPMFAGSFFVLVIPLTLARLGALLFAPSTPRARTLGGAVLIFGAMAGAWMLHPFLAALAFIVAVGGVTYRPALWAEGRSLAGCVYLFVLATEVCALLLTQGRGALIGCFVTVVFMLLLGVTVFSKPASRWRLGVGVGILAGVLLFGGLLLTRLDTDEGNRILRLQTRSTQMRLLTWETMTDILAEHPERWWTGHGPGTTALVFERYYPAALVDFEGGARVARAHNVLYEAWFTRGLPGVLGYLLLLGLLWLTALRFLGVTPTRRYIQQGTASLLVGGLLGGGLAVGLDGSWRLVAPLFALGTVAGLGGYVLIRSLSRREKVHPEPTHTGLRWMVLGMTAALMGHFVDAQFGIILIPIYFYLCTFAVVIGVWAREDPPDVEAPVPGDPDRAVWMGVVLVLGVFAYGMSDLPGGYDVVIWLLALMGVVGGLVYAGMDGNPLTRWTGMDLLKGGLPALLFVGWMWIGPKWILANATQYLNAVLVLYIGLMVWLVAYAWRMGSPTAGAPESTRAAPVIVSAGILALLVGGLIGVVHVPVLQGDAASKFADRARETEKPEFAIPLLEEAMRLQPRQDRYPLLLAGAYQDLARGKEQTSTYDSLFTLALAYNAQGMALQPMDGDHFRNRARLYAAWAEGTADSTGRQVRLDSALVRYARALSFRQNDYRVRDEIGQTALMAGNPQAAVHHFSEALKLEPRYVEARMHLAETLTALGDTAGSLETYREAITLNVYDIALYYRYAESLKQSGMLESALETYGGEPEAVLSGPRHTLLAMLHWVADHCAEARYHVGEAVQRGQADRNFRGFAKNVTESCAVEPEE